MKRNTIASAVAMLLLIATLISTVALPSATAQTPDKEKNTFAMIGAMPNPVGVGQDVLLWVGITDMLYVWTDGWTGITVKVTKPDGATETLGPFRTDSTGSTGTVYKPTMVGTYKLQTFFPAQGYNWTRGSLFDPELSGYIWYKASESKILELVVQQDPIPEYKAAPLPTEYWTRPIDAQHRDWNTISADWLGPIPTNRYAPYNDYAPATAHILWTKQLVTGGLAGGTNGPQAYECGDAYEGKFGTGFPTFSYSIVLGGVLYYNRYESRMPTQEVVAVDLHTGKELWVKNWNNTRVSFGQAFYWDAWNYHGVFGYLWTVSTSGFGPSAVTTWNAFNPVSGDWVFRLTNIPSGTMVYGPKGEIYIYTFNLQGGWMTMWNMTRAVQPQNSGTSNDGSWRPQGRTIDATTTGYMWNKTIPTNLQGSVNMVLPLDRAIGTTSQSWDNIGNTPLTMWAISLKPGQEGQVLFNKDWALPQSDITMNFGTASAEDGVFVIRSKETRQWWGISSDTGVQLWGPTDSEEDLGIFGMNSQIAYGKLYAANKYGGVLYCYDLKTGDLLWTYTARDPSNEILWSNNWPTYIVFIADGKVYMGHSEHSPVDPKPRGAPFICVDAETGEEIWKAEGLFRQTDWGGTAILGDSIIATMDTYDQRIYGIGKGPSATTISAPDVGVTFGSTIILKGTVTDISPGTDDFALKKRFPNGVPAIADEFMSEWMLYVYKLFELPMSATGVSVTISVLDANGNYREIGKTTADADGFFKFSWKPDIEGEFTVYASFEGSEAYYPSHAVTAFFVDEAPPAPTEPQPESPSMTDTYVLAIGAAVIAAVTIFGVIILLTLRKRH